MKYYLPLFLLIVLSQLGAANAPENYLFRSFNHLTTEDGLLGGAVLAILEDRQGFMWFGTQQGLNRYDGYSFKSYGSGAGPDRLSNANVRALLEDEAGNIWIGTWGGGLDRLDVTGAVSVYRSSVLDADDAEYDYVTALTGDGRGGLWVTSRGGLSHFDPATEQFVHLSAGPANALAVAPGRVWLGEREQIALYTDEQGATARRVATYPLPAAAGIVNRVYVDAAERLWVGTENGLWWLEGDAFNRVDSVPPGRHVVSLLDNGDGTVWVSTLGGGLYRLEADGSVVERYVHDEDDERSIASDLVLGLHKSSAGILWAGTWTDGISLLVPRKFPRHLATPVPLAFAPAADGSTWAGMFNGGLWRIGASGETLAQFRHDADAADSLSDDIVFALLPEDSGGLWVGTLGGLNYLSPDGDAFRHYRHDAADPQSLSHDRVRALHRDREGTMWVGTAGGLNRFEPGTGSFSRYAVGAEGSATPFLSVLALAEDARGRLWVGGEDGLAGLDPQSGDGRVYNDNNSGLCNNLVTDIHPAADESLWLASWGGGLIHFRPDEETWRCYQVADGLVDNVVLALAEDAQGMLWLSTPRGLSRFDPEGEQFTTFTTADGLPHNDFVQAAVMARPDGSLWFGNTRGIVHFQPGDIPINAFPPPVVVTAFYLDNQPVTPGPEGPLLQPIERMTEIALAHDQNAIAFDFAALNFLNPEQNQYAYRLRGFDDAWVEAGTRQSTTFTNLDPGTYTFEVIASNNDGVWNREGTAIRLTIATPWWQSWWAYLGYGLLAALLVGAVVRVRTGVHRQALARERRMRERLELIDSMKDAERERIARELHDGLSQTLAGLRYQARAWNTMVWQQPARLESELDGLQNVLEESILDVRRSIYALRPVNLEEVGLVPALEETARTIAQQYGPAVHTNMDVDWQALDPGLELHLFHIGSELLSNAARHARAREVWLDLRQEPGRVTLEARDDGQGFDTTQLEELAAGGHMGLRFLQERVRLLGGTLAIDSRAGGGTRVTVHLPRTEAG